ncbi:MAG: hypothetical protein MJZ38_04810 [archaeon]|nr:hypothetical protein [archaeon]
MMDVEKDMMLSMILLKHQFDYIYADRVRPCGVTFVQAIYMKTINDSEGVITMSKLAMLFGVTRARVTTVLKGVRDAGHLVEEPIDGRTIALSLSPSGKEVVKHFDRIVQDDQGKIIGQLTNEEFEVFKKVISKASEYLKTNYLD